MSTPTKDPAAVKLWEVTQKSVINHWPCCLADQGQALDRLSACSNAPRSRLRNQVQRDRHQAPIEETLLAFCAVANKYVDLSKLYTGDNPFIDELPVLEAKQQKSEPNDLPF